MNHWQSTVRIFQREMEQSVSPQPGHVDPEYKDFLISLIKEEYQELKDAMEGEGVHSIAGEMVDLIWVTLNAANAYGIDLEPFFEAIALANLQKSGGPVAPNGKRLKPDGWKPAPLQQLLQAQITQ